MTTINLYQNKKETSNAASFNANKGLYFSLSVIIVTVLVLVGLNMYVPRLESQNKELGDNIMTENNKLVGLKNLENVIDTQKRLDMIKKDLQIKNGQVTRLETNKVLDSLGLDLSSGVIVEEFDYNGGNISVKFNSGNFNDVAKQINNFKASKYFSGASMTSISRGEQGISCEVAMKINK